MTNTEEKQLKNITQSIFPIFIYTYIYILYVYTYTVYIHIHIHIYLNLSLFLATPHSMRILITQPGIESVPPAVEAWSLNRWVTREDPVIYMYM